MAETIKYNRIEDVINEKLDGVLRDAALDFAAYLNNNQLTPNMSADGKIRYNGYNLGWMMVDGNDKWLFEIFNYLKFGEFSDDDDDFKNAVYDHVSICEAPCHDECWRAKDVKIFGKEFKSVCSQHSRAFVNPDGKTVEHIKKLIEYSKKTEPYEQQYHPTHP
ncbi:MAG: hypothetical protein FWG91_08350 [Lachnospiraceae bacterium]|nr:hypothetical protein [Lachnospiraceae bacterium]